MPRHLSAVLLLGALAACKIGEDETTFPVAANCSPVGNACASHADCCSFGCEAGICARNPEVGGACRTTDDCYWTMTCQAGACQPGGLCRNDLDVCAFDNECCSGNCATGACAANHPPTVDLGPDRTEPFNTTLVLSATVADPEPDTLVYGWTLVSGPAGTALAGWTSGTVSPAVFLDVAGVYVFQLIVTDGPASQRNRLTSVPDQLTITAANLAPVVSAGASVPSHLRNVALAVAGSVSDPNGGASPVTCAWYVKPPNGTEALAQSYPAPCPAAPAFTFTPPVDGAQGDWTLRLEASDGSLTASATRTVTVVNGPPVASAGPDRTGNLGPPGLGAPPVPLAGSATDPNGDVATAGFTFTWTVTAVSAPGTTWTAGAPVGTAAAASFVPDAEGTYTLNLHVDDGRGGTHDDAVVVTAERYLRPLIGDGSVAPLGEIADAVYVRATNRIVMVGTDRSGASPSYKLWIVDPNPDPATQAATVSVALLARPVCLGLSPDGAEALVGEDPQHWQHVTGVNTTSPAASLVYNAPFTPNTLVHAGSRWYAFGPTRTVYELFNGGTTAAAGCQNCTLTGTRAVRDAGGTAVWVLDEGADTLARYDIHPNGSFNQNPTGTVPGLTLVDRLWLSADAQSVVLGDGSRYAASNLTAAGSLPLSPLHFDSTASTGLAGVAFAAPGSTLTTLSSSYASAGPGPFPLPQLGVAGTGYPAAARFAFVRTDASVYYAIVRATVSFADRYYLAAY